MAYALNLDATRCRVCRVGVIVVKFGLNLGKFLFQIGDNFAIFLIKGSFILSIFELEFNYFILIANECFKESFG